jgi:hypothetical protein
METVLAGRWWFLSPLRGAVRCSPLLVEHSLLDSIRVIELVLGCGRIDLKKFTDNLLYEALLNEIQWQDLRLAWV